MSDIDHCSEICPQSLSLSSPDALKRTLAVRVQSNDSLSPLVMDCTLCFKTYEAHSSHWNTSIFLKIGIVLRNVQQTESDLL